MESRYVSGAELIKEKIFTGSELLELICSRKINAFDANGCEVFDLQLCDETNVVFEIDRPQRLFCINEKDIANIDNYCEQLNIYAFQFEKALNCNVERIEEVKTFLFLKSEIRDTMSQLQTKTESGNVNREDVCHRVLNKLEQNTPITDGGTGEEVHPRRRKSYLALLSLVMKIAKVDPADRKTAKMLEEKFQLQPDGENKLGEKTIRSILNEIKELCS